MTTIQRAIDNPAACFSRPRDVLADVDLSREDKIRVLKRWEYDARLLEVAQEENMIARTPSALSEILDSLHALDAEGSSSDPTRGGGS